MTRRHTMDEAEEETGRWRRWPSRSVLVGLDQARMPLGSESDCWCGLPAGHTWEGKDDGRPHPADLRRWTR